VRRFTMNDAMQLKKRTEVDEPICVRSNNLAHKVLTHVGIAENTIPVPGT
jgi:hypothetical protein